MQDHRRSLPTFPSKKVHKNLESRFLNAAETRDIKEIVACLDAGVDPNVRAGDLTALHIAAERGDIYLTLKLTAYPNLEKNPKTLFGATPLLFACKNKTNPKYIKILLNTGADPNIQDKLGTTPLHIVVRNNVITTAMYLLKANADPNIKDIYENTALSIAVLQTNFLPMVKLLIKYGADPNFKTTETPLFLLAVLHCHTIKELIIINFLMDHGTDVNVTDPITKKNALHYVSITGYVPLATELLKNEVNIFHKDVCGKTPIEMAVIHKHENLTKLFEDYLIYLELLKLVNS